MLLSQNSHGWRVSWISQQNLKNSNLQNICNITSTSATGLAVDTLSCILSVAVNAIQQQLHKQCQTVKCANFASSCAVNFIPFDIYTNISINETQIQETLLACDQPIYVTSFDVSTISDTKSAADFNSGYAFSSASTITNAFIDVKDYAYTSTVHPLFQSQSTFTNIKVQVGAQVTTSGSLLSTGSTFVVNCVNILSKEGSQITVNATFKLNILLPKATNAIIANLMLNLSFSAVTQGNISLIETSNGVFNITGYQILGVYQSTSCVALGANSLNSSSVYFNNISVAPSVFNVGNQSSYLFVAVNGSNIEFSVLSIILGNSSNPALSNFVFSIASFQYQFGGLISMMNSTTVKIQDLSYNCKQIFKIYYVQNSGLLIGYMNYSNNNLAILDVCISQIIKCFSSINNFGVIGFLEGNIQIKRSNIFINITSSDIISYFGTVGQTTTNCLYTSLQQTQISVSINENKGTYVCAWIGIHNSPNGTIINSLIKNSNLSSSQMVAGFTCLNSLNLTISFSSVVNSYFNSGLQAACFVSQSRTNVAIQNSSVENTTLSNTTVQAGGFVGYVYAYSTLILSNCSMLNSSLVGLSQVGGLVGESGYGCNQIFSDDYVFNSTVVAKTAMAGGFLGSLNSGTLKIVTSKIDSISITSTSATGLVVGYQVSVFQISDTQMIGMNYLNGILKQNCPNLVSTC
ncbi:Pectin_lyase fold/virulence factor [Hexamita inflata]|uniref:Pectin lyase fold/virulence factor n=1 Tax=Hexamita inflata TaxID=28002 RepID=A0AA86N817_9EUKA|nr:Pectin lyase fold/virulence factor [Hexamita inflata]